MNALILLAAAAGSPALEPVVVTATRTESPAGEVLASVDLVIGATTSCAAGRRPRRCAALRARRRGRAPRRPRPADLAVRARHGIEPRAGAGRRPAHQSRHHRHRRDPERRARVRRARRGRQGPALDAVRLRRDRRRHQHHHAPRRGARRQRAGGLRRLRHAKRQLLRRHRRRARGGLDRGAPGSTARASRPAPATTPTAATRTPRSTASARAGVGPVDLGALAPGTPRARPSTRISSSRPSTRTSRTSTLALTADFAPTEAWSSQSHGRARDRRPRAEPVGGLPRHEAQHDRLAERLRALGSADR